MKKRIDKRWEDMSELHGFTHKRFRVLRKKIRRKIKKSENRKFDKINAVNE